MAYILSRSYILSQLAAVGISEADLNAAPFASKVLALRAASTASAAAVNQIALTESTNLAKAATSLYTTQEELATIQLAAWQKSAVPPKP
jgi:hypothetical protein